MSEKINIQELINELSAELKITKKEAETFLRELFVVMADAIMKDGIVKVKNWGTFKQIEVEARESINVNTGERVLIPSHQKISYVPDKKLNDLINPFEQSTFPETVVPEIPSGCITEEQEPVREPIEEEAKISPVAEEVREIPSETIPDIEDTNKEKSSILEKRIGGSEMMLVTLPKNLPPPKMKTQRVRKRFFSEYPVFSAIIFIVILCVLLYGVYYFITRSNKKEYITTLKDVASRSYVKPSGNIIENVDSLKEVRMSRRFEEQIAAPLLGIPQKEEDQKDAVATGEDKKPDAETVVSAKKAEPENKAPDKKAEPEKNIPEIMQKPVVNTPEKKPEPVKNTAPEVKPTTPVHAPTPAVSTGQKKITVQQGEMLTVIALREFGDKIFWVYIYDANKQVISNPNNVAPGTVLMIPAAQTYGIDKDNPESVSKARNLAGQIVLKFQK